MKRFGLLILVAVLAVAHGPAAWSRVPNEAAAPSAARQILVMLRQLPAHYRGSGTYRGGYADAAAKASRERTGRRLAAEHGLRFVSFYPMPEVGLDCLVLEASAASAVADVVAAIERDRSVEWAEPVEIYESRSTTAYNDPLFLAAPAAQHWQLADLHRTATGRGVTVAVVDSGIDAAHPDLAGQIWLSRNFVEGRAFSPEAHGTGVAGVIAARGNNGKGIVGVAPEARVLGLRGCWEVGERSVCDSVSLARALHFAVDSKTDVLNLSLTGPASRLLGQLIDRAIANRSVVVAAVDPTKVDGGFPASKKGVVAVADSAAGARASQGYQAPGNGIPTTSLHGKWDFVNGSSFAAAHVSGLFALLIETKGSRGSPPGLVAARDGGGVIDVHASLRKAAGR
jgi:subtilisin family serine protease